MAKMNTSAQIHDTKAGIMNLAKEEVLLAEKAAIAPVIHNTKYYNSLTTEELSEFTLQGLVATRDGWLGGQHHCSSCMAVYFAKILAQEVPVHT